MTAFARSEAEFSWGTLVWEIRSVNQRFLEPHFKLPDFMRQHEIAIRDKLRKRLARGKVECSLRFHESVGQQSVQVDQVRLQQINEALQQIKLSGASEGRVDPLALLQFPGVMNSTSADPSEVGKAALSLFDDALAQLIEGRQREGVELAGLIEERLQSIASIVGEIRSKMPQIIENQKANLVERVSQLGVDLDAERLEQEVVLLAQRADVAEELDRLDTHVTEVRRILKEKGPIGRKLDFLMQELNREANTLGSKSVVVATTQSAVELKVLIEQMREQIQNIE
ncbi:YicC/YloC family endoribonuclease [Marinobacterium sp. xm-d-579]|uniref:YicC/YloC family endoribonuclease n=1 Tax=Marinobacterium sp. xm-d-579 TaxID=2497734 RepID=UPI0020C4369A|nr:YicC/YloC family endoribonuclease [Marinobacterium sp. xm-d-579]